MSSKLQSIRKTLVPFFAATFTASCAFAQQTTAFSYQGQLSDHGTNANGTYALTFKLYDAVSAGNQIGSTLTNVVSTINGLFSVNLDFGAGAFNGSLRWLDVTVRAGTNAPENLSPRTQVLSSPYAQFALLAGTVTNGGIMNAQLSANAVGTTNIKDGAISDSKMATNTTFIKSPESNLRVIRGIIGSDGNIYSGSGFTVTVLRPGSGGTSAGDPFNITQNGSDYELHASGDRSGPFHPRDWVNVGGLLLQVKSIEVDTYCVNPPACTLFNTDTTILLNGTGCGGLSSPVQVFVRPRLATEFTVTFTVPFATLPVITVACHGDSALPFSSGSAPWVVSKRSPTDGGRFFGAIVGYDLRDDGYPGCPPYGEGFEFIAIGP